MVDFQSRDTRRGIDGEDDNGDASDDGPGGEAETREVETGATPGEAFGYAVVTVAADRTVSADPPGEAVVSTLEAAGATVATRDIVRPSYDGIQSAVDGLVGRRDVGALVTVGGTGVEPDDVTVDALEPLFDKRLPGFGELFRILSHDHDGTAVVGTRATAGIVDAVPVFAVPGTVDGATRAVGEVVLPEAEGLADDARSNGGA